jgi:hypothetical protein
MNQPVDELPTGIVQSVALSPKRGRKYKKDWISLIQDMGVEGDAHFNTGPRQVSILLGEKAEEAGFSPEPGDFAENIIVRNLDSKLLTPGVRLRVGPCLLEVVGIGKPEWKAGDYNFQGRALLAEGGIYLRVMRGGVVVPGDGVEIVGRKITKEDILSPDEMP